MAYKQKEYHVTVTTDWTLVPGVPQDQSYSKMLVENLGAAHVEIAFGSTDYIDATIRGFITKMLDSDDLFVGKMYIRHLGGFDPDVVIRLWR